MNTSITCDFKCIHTFLISSFRRVQNVVCFLLGDSPASDLYMPTFRNTLSVPSSKAGAFEDGTDRVFRNVGIYKSDAGESPKRKQTTLKFLSPTNATLYYTYKMLKYTARSFPDCSYMFRSTWTIISEPMPNLAKVTILCRYSVKIRRLIFSNVGKKCFKL